MRSSLSGRSRVCRCASRRSVCRCWRRPGGRVGLTGSGRPGGPRRRAGAGRSRAWCTANTKRLIVVSSGGAGVGSGASGTDHPRPRPRSRAAACSWLCRLFPDFLMLRSQLIAARAHVAQASGRCRREYAALGAGGTHVLCSYVPRQGSAVTPLPPGWPPLQFCQRAGLRVASGAIDYWLVGWVTVARSRPRAGSGAPRGSAPHAGGEPWAATPSQHEAAAYPAERQACTASAVLR
jgi:hypothetical protein